MRNDVTLAGLIHKMATEVQLQPHWPLAKMVTATATLLASRTGLRYMFMMMNEARIGVGYGAAMIGIAAPPLPEYAKIASGRAAPNLAPEDELHLLSITVTCDVCC